MHIFCNVKGDVSITLLIKIEKLPAHPALLKHDPATLHSFVRQHNATLWQYNTKPPCVKLKR